MPSATFKHGKPGMIDHTPSGNVTAGDVIIVNGGVRIAHSDIAADNLGALADGGGVYEVTAASELEADDGAIAFWNASTGATRTNSDAVFGRFVRAKVSGETTALIRHINVIDT